MHPFPYHKTHQDSALRDLLGECSSYLSCCCDKPPWPQQLKEGERFTLSQFQSAVHHCTEYSLWRQEREAADNIAFTFRRQRPWELVPNSLPPFHFVGQLGWVFLCQLNEENPLWIRVEICLQGDCTLLMTILTIRDLHVHYRGIKRSMASVSMRSLCRTFHIFICVNRFSYRNCVCVLGEDSNVIQQKGFYFR